MITRRRLLGAAVAAGLARPAVAAAAENRAAPALERLLVLEQHAALAYRTAGGAELARIGDQEHDHALALATLLGGYTLHAPDPPEDPSELHGTAAELAGGGGLEAAIALERSLLKAHRKALPLYEEPEMRRTAATIMASHGQHLSVLYERSGGDPMDSGR